MRRLRYANTPTRIVYSTVIAPASVGVKMP